MAGSSVVLKMLFQRSFNEVITDVRREYWSWVEEARIDRKRLDSSGGEIIMLFKRGMKVLELVFQNCSRVNN